VAGAHGDGGEAEQVAEWLRAYGGGSVSVVRVDDGKTDDDALTEWGVALTSDRALGFLTLIINRAMVYDE